MRKSAFFSLSFLSLVNKLTGSSSEVGFVIVDSVSDPRHGEQRAERGDLCVLFYLFQVRHVSSFRLSLNIVFLSKKLFFSPTDLK